MQFWSEETSPTTMDNMANKNTENMNYNKDCSSGKANLFNCLLLSEGIITV